MGTTRRALARRLGVIAVGVALASVTVTGAALADDGSTPTLPVPLFNTGFSLPDVSVPDLGDLPGGLPDVGDLPELPDLPLDAAPRDQARVPARPLVRVQDGPAGNAAGGLVEASPKTTSSTSSVPTTATTTVTRVRSNHWRHRFRCYDDDSFYDGYYDGYSRGYANGYLSGSNLVYSSGTYDDGSDNPYDVYYNRCPTNATNRSATTTLTPTVTTPIPADTTALAGEGVQSVPQNQISGNSVPAGGVSTGDGSFGP